MERITIHVRTTKTDGDVNLRFRLRDGRNIQLYYKSHIKASLKDLAKFNVDGSLKPRTSIYNKDLQKEIISVIDIIHKAYSNLVKKGSNITSELLCNEIEAELHPIKKEKESLVQRFDRFIQDGYRDGLFSVGRMRHYYVVLRILERFLIIENKSNILPQDFDSVLLMNLDLFIRDEYIFVTKYPDIYSSCKKRNIPMNRRSSNTVATKMKYLHAFFRELEEREEIVKSPFQKLGRERKRNVMVERYDDPVYLYVDELRKVLEANVPSDLEEVRDVFCLQCAFGCRIGDFKNLTMEKIAINEGIPYIHYLPRKTLRENRSYKEIETPIIKFAWDIIQKYDFKFPILRNISGKDGYNVRIKKLLKSCGIDRKCKVFNEEKGDNEYKPLYELASSKLCRKTHVDIMSKVQIDQYVTGLHKFGSNAVSRYTKLELKDLFKLMCVAFEEPIYSIE